MKQWANRPWAAV
jgi:hypothetical protein